MEKGKLYGVSVGPGDPELLTLRAVRVLQEVDVVAAPKAGGSSRAALRIVQPYLDGKAVLDCPTPMTRDLQATACAYDAIAADIAGLLDAGKSVAFVTLGDASVYSTWSYVSERFEGRGYETEVVPGVPSFCAAAAVLQEPLCTGPEQLLVVPVSAGGFDEALDRPGTKVFMKSGRRLEALRDALEARNLTGSSSLVANCGLPGQEVLRGLEGAEELPGYLSVAIVRDRQEAVRAERDGPAGGASATPPDEGVHPLLREAAEGIAPPDEAAHERAFARWNAVAKPIGGLGSLEGAVARIAALTGSEDVKLERRAVAVLCADNGVVARGVTQCDSGITAAVAAGLARGTSSVCRMAATARAEVFAYDLGMNESLAVDGIVDARVAAGTGDIARGPAMTRDQALQAIREGMRIAASLKERGFDIVAAGEMGIGNTTTASAVAAVLLGLPPRQVVGRGAGLSDVGLARKRAVVEQALAVNAPDARDALDVLAKVGGLDIAGLAGLYIGGAQQRIPVIVDGFISATAALVAARLVPACHTAMLASHVSEEPAAQLLLEALGLEAPLHAGMHLGEGTGAVCLLPLLDAALALYGGTTFDAAGIKAYAVNP